MKTIVPWPLWLAIVLCLAALPDIVWGQPIATASAGGITITIDTDKCELDGVTNLAGKATWTEKGKTFKGCWAPHPNYGMLMFFFEDKTVVILPGEAFTRVISS